MSTLNKTVISAACNRLILLSEIAQVENMFHTLAFRELHWNIYNRRSIRITGLPKRTSDWNGINCSKSVSENLSELKWIDSFTFLKLNVNLFSPQLLPLCTWKGLQFLKRPTNHCAHRIVGISGARRIHMVILEIFGFLSKYWYYFWAPDNGGTLNKIAVILNGKCSYNLIF